MSSHKKDRFEEVIRDLAARFFSIESNRTSMITVTKVESNTNNKIVTVYMTVYPENQEEAAMDFARRNLSDFRDFVKEKSRLALIPFFKFEIDRGEKARQKIDALTI